MRLEVYTFVLRIALLLDIIEAKGGISMAIKTANVNSRMKLDIKQQAESILERLGIPRSVAIDMFYRQIIAHNGIPFALTLPTTVSVRDEMSTEQFYQMMSIGLEQARENDSFDVDAVFEELEQEIDQ